LNSRERPLGSFSHLVVDARYEKVRYGGVVQSLASRGLHGVEYIVSDDHLGLKKCNKVSIPWRYLATLSVPSFSKCSQSRK